MIRYQPSASHFLLMVLLGSLLVFGCSDDESGGQDNDTSSTSGADTSSTSGADTSSTSGADTSGSTSGVDTSGTTDADTLVEDTRPTTELLCGDGFDDDGDGDLDCDDSDCAADPVCSCDPASEFTCADGACIVLTAQCDAVSQCADASDEAPANLACVPFEDGPTLCADGVDNDNDGFIDCAGFRCQFDPANATLCGPREGTNAACADLSDNDNNSFTDCADFGCQNDKNWRVSVCLTVETTEGTCDDGVDNDSDGSIDCADSACAAATACGGVGFTEADALSCSDALDNDLDGLIDCADPQCATSRPCALCANPSGCLCLEDERVSSGRCVPCAPGSTRAEGDNTSGADTLCAPTLCGVNTSVAANTCAPCAPDTFNLSGDDASSADTTCDDDACFIALGVLCADFEQAYIKASNTGAGDYFGISIALSGDTLAVGASGEESSATSINGDPFNNSAWQSGAVYVFTRSGSTWTQQAYIKASNAESNDRFGASIALDGDTLAVGAYNEDSNATGVNGDPLNNASTNSGAVYVFTRSGSTWTQRAYIKPSNTGSDGVFGDHFGASLALDGGTLAVGADNEDSNATGINNNQADNSAIDSGAVYVFTGSGSAWTQQAYLKASNTGASDRFGVSVSLSGDTLAVGAYQESSDATGINGDQSNNATTNSGAAYVFTRSGSTWTQQAYIKASNTDGGDTFGISVALDGDTLAVGAYGESSAATGVNGDQADDSIYQSGAVYVFTRSGSTWTQQAYLKASNPDAGDYFGVSLALDGDTLAVGAPREDSHSAGLYGDQASNFDDGSGAIYLFTRAGTTWTQQAYVKASSAWPASHYSDQFGQSVSLDRGTLAVGAFAEDSSATGVNGDQSAFGMDVSGAAYIRLITP